MNAGDPNEWAKPMNPRATGHEAYGNWKGSGAIYNIINRQMGFRYVLANEADVDRKLNLGYEVVDSAKGHTERFAGHGRVSARHGEVKSTEMKLGPFWLLRMRQEQWNAIQEAATRQRLAEMDVPTQMLISQNTTANEQLRRLSATAGRNYAPRDGSPFYIADPSHGANGYAHEDAEAIR